MHFIFIGRDKPGSLAVRLSNRETHLAFLATQADTVKVAGPYLDEVSGEPRGSLLIIEADDIAAARAIVANDPYALAGLFETADVHPWRWVIGAPKA